ncbi:MAG: Zn-dependent hydrolase, partial [Planctomycetota bacterium]
MTLILLVMAAGSRPLLAQQADQHAEPDLKRLVGQYVPVTLTADLSKLSDNEQEMIPLLVEAAKLMDECFWYQAYGDSQELLSEASELEANYIRMNYGPWDRLADNRPFLKGVGPKPLGANFYPTDMTQKEFEAANLRDK